MQLNKILLLATIIGTFVSLSTYDFKDKIVESIPFIGVSYAATMPVDESKSGEEKTTGEITTESKETVRPGLSRPKELWLASLEYCESQGRSDLRIIDTNGYYSYGAFQFQMGTFIGFGKQYGVLDKDMTYEEARGVNKDGPIYDQQIQKEIVVHMVEDGLDYHWYNCTKKFGHYPQY